jgi:hypothetical protein
MKLQSLGDLRNTQKNLNGWKVGSLFGDRAFYNGDWLKRAAAAKGGIYGNDAVEAMYPMTKTLVLRVVTTCPQLLVGTANDSGRMMPHSDIRDCGRVADGTDYLFDALPLWPGCSCRSTRRCRWRRCEGCDKRATTGGASVAVRNCGGAFAGVARASHRVPRVKLSEQGRSAGFRFARHKNPR